MRKKRLDVLTDADLRDNGIQLSDSEETIIRDMNKYMLEMQEQMMRMPGVNRVRENGNSVCSSVDSDSVVHVDKCEKISVLERIKMIVRKLFSRKKMEDKRVLKMPVRKKK